MNLIEALHEIAQQLDLPTDELAHYAAEDAVGGYEPGNPNTPWSVGSMFGVEGQVLYALTRALKPRYVAEFGTHDGCSATHFLAALAQCNRAGALTSVDPWEGAGSRVPEGLRSEWHLVFTDGILWLEQQPDASFDILFEDMMHSVEQVRDWWTVAQRKIKPGGLIISHDAGHFLVGNDVMQGIVEAGVSGARVYLIEPSDCGLAIWKAPKVETAEFEGFDHFIREGYVVPTYEEMTEVKKPAKKRKPKAAKE